MNEWERKQQLSARPATTVARNYFTFNLFSVLGIYWSGIGTYRIRRNVSYSSRCLSWCLRYAEKWKKEERRRTLRINVYMLTIAIVSSYLTLVIFYIEKADNLWWLYATIVVILASINIALRRDGKNE